MAILYSGSVVVTSSDPNGEADLQGGQQQLLAITDDGAKVYRFVAANGAGLKWVHMGCGGAVDDPVDPSTVGTNLTTDVSVNDFACPGVGVRTYALIAGSESNVYVVDNGDGTFDAIPLAVGFWSYIVGYYCDGVLTDTSITSGTAIAPVTPSFSMQFTTTAPGETVHMPIQSVDGAGILEFDDGTANIVGVADSATHTFATAGTYVVKYYGTATSFEFGGGASTPDKQYLTGILDWGNSGATAANFRLASNIQVMVSSLPASIVDLTNFLAFTTAIPNLSALDVSNVTNMTTMFNTSDGNPDTALWDVSSVTNMLAMFNSTSTANPDVSNWTVTSVLNMQAMFSGAAVATPVTTSWNTSSVTNMSGLFSTALLANPDVSTWNTSSVLNMSSMFGGAVSATPNVSSWNTSSVTDMSAMFAAATIANPDVSTWDVSSVQNMSNMFASTTLANPNVSSWNTSSVTNMSSVFQDTTIANPDVSAWDTSLVTSVSSMFKEALAATPTTVFSAAGANGGGDAWNTSNVQTALTTFENAPLSSPTLKTWKLDSITNMNNIFNGSNISVSDYDQTLIAWDVQATAHTLVNIPVGIVPQNYTTATSGTERANLITAGWTISDLGGI